MNETRTDQRLLETAIRLFAHDGYDGTSIRAITRAAGANLGAVTYHFGGKRELYERAFQACIGPLASRITGRIGGAGSALTRLDEVLALFVDYLSERPELPHLMLRETVAGRRPPAGVLKELRGLLGALATLIAEGQASGEFGAGDARLMAISVVSQPLHLTLVTRVIEGMEPGGAATRARLLEHMRRFIRDGLGRPESGKEG